MLAREIRIMADPGHGPGDGSYALAAYDVVLREEALNFAIAQSVEAHLEQAGIPVRVSRNANEDPMHTTRLARALEFKATHLISIHHNHAPFTGIPLSAQGKQQEYEQALLQEKIAIDTYDKSYAKTELYLHEDKNINATSAWSGRLTTPFNRVSVYRTLPSTDASKAWMSRVRNVLDRYAKNGIHACLVECGYIDMPSHQKVIQSPEYVSRMSKAIADFIKESVGGQSKA